MLSFEESVEFLLPPCAPALFLCYAAIIICIRRRRIAANIIEQQRQMQRASEIHRKIDQKVLMPALQQLGAR